MWGGGGFFLVNLFIFFEGFLKAFSNPKRLNSVFYVLGGGGGHYIV